MRLRNSRWNGNGRNRMNIKEAKEQIKNAMTAYFTKDSMGSYTLPTHQQRHVFLM